MSFRTTNSFWNFDVDQSWPVPTFCLPIFTRFVSPFRPISLFTRSLFPFRLVSPSVSVFFQKIFSKRGVLTLFLFKSPIHRLTAVFKHFSSPIRFLPVINHPVFPFHLKMIYLINPSFSFSFEWKIVRFSFEWKIVRFFHFKVCRLTFGDVNFDFQHWNEEKGGRIVWILSRAFAAVHAKKEVLSHTSKFHTTKFSAI